MLLSQKHQLFECVSGLSERVHAWVFALSDGLHEHVCMFCNDYDSVSEGHEPGLPAQFCLSLE